MDREELVTVQIHPDHHAESPRDWQDNAGVIYCKHRRYTLGDKNADDPYEEVEFKVIDGIKITAAQWDNDELPEGVDRSTIDEAWEQADWDSELAVRDDVAIIMPLYLYDHSGITMSHSSFSCPWDSGQVGWHYMTKDVLDSEFGGDKERGYACLKAELQEYDNYLQGNVWGYTIEGPGIDDSCWRFIGTELDEAGLLDHIDSKFHDAVRAAWEANYDSRGVRTIYCTADGVVVDPDEVEKVVVRRAS